MPLRIRSPHTSITLLQNRIRIRMRIPLTIATRLHSTSTATAAAAAARTPALPLLAAQAHCATLLSHQDHASHLLTPFFPAGSRPAHIALRAFNLDIAAIDSTTSNTALSRMRLQFWRDTVSKIFSTTTTTTTTSSSSSSTSSSPTSSTTTTATKTTVAAAVPAEPVATLLAHCVRDLAMPLSKGFLTKVISAREKYVGGRPFESLTALEEYAEGVYGSLQYLTLQSVGRESTTLDHIGSHIGKASGVVAVLRGVPILATGSVGGRGGKGGKGSEQVVLPLDVMAEFGVRQEDVIRHGPQAEGLRDAVFRVATLANDHLITARKMARDAGEEATRSDGVWAGFMQAVAARTYLERLEKADFDPFHVELQKRAWTLPWRLWRSSKTRTF